MDIDPRYALGWYNIGVIYDQEEKYDDAIEMYLKAASLNPGVLDSSMNPQVVSNRHLTAVLAIWGSSEGVVQQIYSLPL